MMITLAPFWTAGKSACGMCTTLLTGANKSSYIDNFLDRSLNATQLAEGLNKALYGENEYSWFIN